MFCRFCGKPNDDDSHFFMSCGKPIHAAIVEKAVDLTPAHVPQPRLQENNLPVAPERYGSQEGLGLMLLALFTVFHILFWQIFTKANPTWYENKPLTNVLNFLFVGEWIIMIVFAKRNPYRLVIIIAAILVIGFNVYSRFFDKY
jgi:hypothetical protein